MRRPPVPIANAPIAAFIEAACVPLAAHTSGTLDEAEAILSRHPHVAGSTIHAAAILGDEAAVRGFLMRNPADATAAGGPYRWDALTHLCFSRYLRRDARRSDAFVRTARALLDAGASAKTGWFETIDHPNPRPIFESAIYGAAGIARHPGLTHLLLEHGADPSLMTRFGDNALHHAIRRDNSLEMIELLLEHGADPSLPNARDGRSTPAMAARRGRGDVLERLAERNTPADLRGVDRLIGACAVDDRDTIRAVLAADLQLKAELLAQGGTLLAEFAGVGNVAGVRALLDCGVGASSIYEDGDPYFDIAKGSTALHVAAWRAWPDVVKELIARGAPVQATDAKGRTAPGLAVKACVDSHWTGRRTPNSVRALLDAGASPAGIEMPSGYEEVWIGSSASVRAPAARLSGERRSRYVARFTPAARRPISIFSAPHRR
jgi:hypothetical protein